MQTPAQLKLQLKQFRASGCLSYFLVDASSRHAVLIDPSVELMNDYRSFIADQRLRLTHVIDTQTHDEHYSASQEFRAECGVPIVMSELTQSKRATFRAKDGDLIHFGSLNLKVIHTPGHSLDSICLSMDSASLRRPHGLLFTGDTLLIGSSGRAISPDSDPSQLWKSLHRIFELFPSETTVFPSHDYNDVLFSTIEAERTKNSLSGLTLEQFCATKAEEAAQTGLTYKLESQKRVDFNLSSDSVTELSFSQNGAALLPGHARESNLHLSNYASLSVEKYSQKLKESHRKEQDSLFIDVREQDEYSDGYIPGTVNIPLSEIGLYLNDLGKDQKIYISCLSGRRSSMVTKTLGYLGYSQVVNVLGGFKAWVHAGLPVAKP